MNWGRRDIVLRCGVVRGSMVFRCFKDAMIVLEYGSIRGIFARDCICRRPRFLEMESELGRSAVCKIGAERDNYTKQSSARARREYEADILFANRNEEHFTKWRRDQVIDGPRRAVVCSERLDPILQLGNTHVSEDQPCYPASVCD